MLKKMTGLFIIVFMTFSGFAQTGYTIKGKVLNENNVPLDLVSVTMVLNLEPESAQTKYTDVDGSFEIGPLKAGKYTLMLRNLGFEPYQQELSLEGGNPVIEVPNINLVQNAKLLKEVTITSKVPFVERKLDRTIINVDALISNAGSNVLDALERAPGVSVDQNGGIKLKGRGGVSVFIDDKPSYLSGSELESYLKSLSTDNIKRIEIMTNPPAKYEAAGNSGVINIITKRNKGLGVNGNAVLSFQQGQYSRSNNSLNINSNTKKFSLYANLSGGFRNSFQDLNINRYYKNADEIRTSSFSQNSYIVQDGKSANAKIGADYYLNESSTIGTSIKGLSSPGGNQTDNVAIIRGANGIESSRVKADNNTRSSFDNLAYNAYYRRQLDSLGSNLIFDVDYVTYRTNGDQKFKNFVSDSSGLQTYQDQVNGKLPSDIKIFAMKGDFTKMLNQSTKLEAGLKTAYSNTDNQAIYSTTIDGVTQPNYDLSNAFTYKEWIHAAYFSLTKSFGNFDVQAGLRAERTVLEGNQLGNILKPDTLFNRAYINLFPTFFASWKADGNGFNIFSFSFGRRIDRPYFQDLNPFVSPLDKFTFYGGNPGLLPTYSNNFSLSHSYKGFLNTSFNFSKTLDGVNETLEIKDGIYYSRPGNIATNYTYSLSVDGAVPVAKWYSINAYIETGHLVFKSQLYNQQLNSNGTYFFITANNSFNLGKDWNAELRGDYQSDVISGQLLIKSYGTLNLAFQKKILGNKGTIKLAFGDILYTRRADGIINNLQLTDADWNSRLDTRSATLSFSYRFGKSTNNKLKHTESGSETEQKRVKS
jgi:hypothetical protein